MKTSIIKIVTLLGWVFISSWAFAGIGGPTGSGGGGTSGTIGSSTSGAPTVYTGTTSVGGISNAFHAGSGTLAAAFAKCPGGNTACIIYADPGQTYTIGNTPLAVGTATKPETLFCNGATISCNGTAGADCLDIGQKGRVIGTMQSSSGTNGCTISNTSSSNITSLVTNTSHANQSGFDLEGVALNPSRSGTMSNGALWLSGEDGFGYVANVSWAGPPNGGIGFEIDDGPAGTDFFNDITIVDPHLTCSGAESAKALYIHHNAGNSGSNVNVYGGAIVDCSFADATPSNLVDIDGGTSGVVSDIALHDTYLESFCPGGDTCTGTGDMILVNNANDITLGGVKFNGGPLTANCVHVTGSQAGQINAWGRVTASICTDLINNPIQGYTNTNAGDFNYFWPGKNNAVTSGGLLPPYGNPCNLAFDATTTWSSLTPTGDLACGASNGQLTVTGIETTPITTTFPASTAGYTVITNASNQLVPTQLPADACSTVGCVNSVTTTGTPNTYAAVNTVTQGDVLTDNGAAALPSYQANEAPLPLVFSIDGTISNSTNRIRVCPATLRVAPGFVTSYPFKASQATIGTNPSQTDTYTLTDVTNSNASVGTAQTTSGGVWSFATTGCSASFDGTQGSTAWARSASATTLNATIPTVATGDGGLLLCTVSGNSSAWTTPSGWTPVTGGSSSAAASSMILYERNMVSGDSGGTVTCTSGIAAAGMNASVFTLKGVPTSGEIVDVVSVLRGSGTSCAPTTITPTHNGELVLQACGTGNNSTVSSWSPANTNVATSANGTGAQYLIQGTAGATGTATATWSGSSAWGGFQLAFLNSATSCTLCTAGDQMKLAGPTSGTNGADVNIDFIGVK